ncbi:NUDIX domain-containing protein [Schleiferilactobacillus perolens]|jgi:8-oxo-dGTP diphosphatase|uniref:Nudix hydrolase domain-containing protein n=2 Tax=Schleiferilactobacillus perolens TaxID=100468 RepID=A0A0R1MU05_9LACO|nr:hypothetical protein FD09_GL000570 [Schleiferilactobacillus perolens DSM 12744]
MQMAIPTFGQLPAGMSYATRTGAYVVIPDADRQRILVLIAPNGALILPGGGMEAGEDQQATLTRELREEFGIAIPPATYLGEAADYYYSRHRRTAFYNPGYFFATTGYKKIAPPLEDFNILTWQPIITAQFALKRASHRWALDQWLQTQGVRPS